MVVVPAVVVAAVVATATGALDLQRDPAAVAAAHGRLDVLHPGRQAAEPGREDRAIGGASLYDHEPAQARARIGYWLTAEGRGRGIATHAVRLLSDWALTDLGVARLEITCAPGNVASQRVAERCGFVREGLLRSHMRFKGGRRDTLVYGRVA